MGIDYKYLETCAQAEKWKTVNRIVFNDTLDKCDTPLLSQAIKESISKEYIVFEEDDLNITPVKGNTNIIISKKRSFEAAKEYKGQKVAVLDFANNHSIGGSPRTAGAQEECMCRCSTLYPCLEHFEDEYYEYHKDLFDNKKLDYFGNDDLIYVPNVVVFKSDESIPKELDEREWFNVDVIVSAAPKLWKDYEYDWVLFERLIRSRIKKILDVASKEDVDVLILGAFGCGAFNNPPKIVAKVFKELLDNYFFKTVEFAVFCRDEHVGDNYDVFNNILK